MHLSIRLASLICGFLTAGLCAHGSLSFETVSSPGVSPAVAYAVDTASGTINLHFQVGELKPGFPHPQVRLGVAGSQTVMLNEKDAQVVPMAGGWAYTFSIPFSGLGADPSKADFRWAFLVDWVDASGQSVQRQNFLVPSNWPPHRDIGREPSAWNVFSMGEYLARQARHEQKITLKFEQPMDGKASVVIENAAGQRVRNLVTGQAFSSGSHEIVWDGLDEQGLVVSPGDYTWRAISHPGLKPELLMFFYNPGEKPWAEHTWLADHSDPTSAAAYGDKVLLGAPVAEAGNNIILADLEGKKLAGVRLSSFIGEGRLFIALGPDRFYAFSEGSPRYESVRKDENGKPYLYGDLSMVAWDHEGNQQRYKGKNGEHIVRTYRKLPEEALGNRKNKMAIHNLSGAAFLDGKIYLSLHDENLLLILDPVTGGEAGSIAVSAPGPVTSDGKSLFVLSGEDLHQIPQPAPGAKSTKLFTPRLSASPGTVNKLGQSDPVATSLAVGAGGEILIADNGEDQNIKVFNAAGKLLREIGQRGGRAPQGPWQADAIRRPAGIAVDSMNRVWLAENVGTPKRISVWDAPTGKVVREFFGPTPYGGTGGGVDPKDASRWVGGGGLWKLDFTKKSATLESILFNKTRSGEMAENVDGRNVQFIHQDGRTFLITKPRILEVFELMPDGSAKIRAVMGGLETFQSNEPRWAVPGVFTEHPLLAKELEAFTLPAGALGDLRNHDATSSSKNARDYFVLWTDVNGDGIGQLEELQVSGPGPRLLLPYWAPVNHDLNLGFLLQREDKSQARTSLKLQGYHPSGAPNWQLTQAYADAVPLQDPPPSNLQSTLVDFQNRFLLNTSPMTALDPDGSTRWTIRNDWVGVHGSHAAPLPETGVIQGALSFLGLAPFDKEGEITVLNGNHGRCFALTTDGIYLDEMSHDVRVVLDPTDQYIGGEAFGGAFGRDPKTGKYLLQAGHGAYRIYEVVGLDQLVRSSGKITVTPAQIEAAESVAHTAIADTLSRKEASIPSVADGIQLGKNPADWPGAWTAEWGNPGRPFPYARVKARRQGTDMVLGYEVKDPSPWVNRGTARNLLFKSGDCVDFQFSTDPGASSKRTGPVPGDRRLLIADFEGKPTAILYDFKVPGTTDPVAFNSPSRSALVDRVEACADARIEWEKSPDGYRLVTRIPLATLGLPTTGPLLLSGDFGVIYGDADGTINTLRSYWSNPSTGLVNDVPGETMITPARWGTLRFE
jgi:hypothetical protein